MSRKAAELSTETKELIVTLSHSVQNKAELSRLLNTPFNRRPVSSVGSAEREAVGSNPGRTNTQGL